ncbi:MAG: MFS transporter [Gammaproteobacteria bacterium]|nr:MFS transporter [Gammaproteobacteria bacterium]
MQSHIDLKPKTSWLNAFNVYLNRRVIAMLFLGFAAGLPFPLVFTTLSTWLRQIGISKTVIGFFAWIGITYSIKIFWAPVVDRLRLPVLTPMFGQRRGWMLLAQAGIIIGLIGMAWTDPSQYITQMALFSLLVAFSSATQDIVIDAYRIEAVKDEFQGAMAATYQAGWRIAAALVAGAAALYISEYFSWTVAYTVMAAFMGVGIITVLLISEPERNVNQLTYLQEQRVIDYLESAAHVPTILREPVAWFIGAVICPFTDFFQRNSKQALFILLFIGIYRISDIVLANMTHPFYIDMGFSVIEIANIAKIFGVIMTLLGAFVGGVLVVRYGILRILLLGAILVSLTNLMFALLADNGHSIIGLTIVLSSDNFSGGLASTAFIAYLSSLTNKAYTATQYALFSSLMTLGPKFISGFSGMVIDAQGYIFFFAYAAALGIPAIFMVIYLMKHKNETKIS